MLSHNKLVTLVAILGIFLFAFIYAESGIALVLVLYMLLFPLLDNPWLKQLLIVNKPAYKWSLLCALLLLALVLLNVDQWYLIVTAVAFAALPEEWFFRAYLQQKLGNQINGILISSVCFSVAHAISIHWQLAVLVFIPSLIFGWVYAKHQDLVLNVLLHGLANSVFIIYLSKTGVYQELINYLA